MPTNVTFFNSMYAKKLPEHDRLGDVIIEGTATVDFDRLFHVNVRAPFILTREPLPLLRESKGQIVFINSSAALHTAPYWGLYAASKSALKFAG